MATDLIGVSQPTIYRIYLRIRPLPPQVLDGISLDATIEQGHLPLIDGTYIPAGNRPATAKATERQALLNRLNKLPDIVILPNRAELYRTGR
ncbi:hypothetical protein [Actinomyces ruminis]|uniref:Uncharacterized protein n=1 Tax=Actinomyces ruminis TaxID=1937003 RepID=A0ABX4M9H8_9ACTO|nr:hypothetical protein [Actinomyces ruminis]PHP51828.1 hypothetical protein BW737_014270 [Actinomyces ruminis]